jgi:hypothetical protein
MWCGRRMEKSSWNDRKKYYVRDKEKGEKEHPTYNKKEEG